MAVRLERKIFTCFKWLILLIPIFLFCYTSLRSYLNKQDDIKLFSNSEYVAWANDYYGEDYYDSLSQIDEFQIAMYDVSSVLNSYLPKFTYHKGTRTYSNNLMVAIYDVTFNSQNINQSLSPTSFWTSLMTYLSYVIVIEVIFMAIYLFRFFIHFFINLFERKQDL